MYKDIITKSLTDRIFQNHPDVEQYKHSVPSSLQCAWAIELPRSVFYTENLWEIVVYSLR